MPERPPSPPTRLIVDQIRLSSSAFFVLNSASDKIPFAFRSPSRSIAAKTSEPHARLPGTIHSAAEEIRQAGGQALPIQCDIRLAELVDAGLLRSMTLGGRTVYEHDYGYPQHDHLHCQKCNKLIEFHSDEVAKIGEALAQEYQFRVTGHRLIFSGICADCRVQKRPTRKLDLV